MSERVSGQEKRTNTEEVPVIVHKYILPNDSKKEATVEVIYSDAPLVRIEEVLEDLFQQWDSANYKCAGKRGEEFSYWVREENMCYSVLICMGMNKLCVRACDC